MFEDSQNTILDSRLVASRHAPDMRPGSLASPQVTARRSLPAVPPLAVLAPEDDRIGRGGAHGVEVGVCLERGPGMGVCRLP